LPAAKIFAVIRERGAAFGATPRDLIFKEFDQVPAIWAFKVENGVKTPFFRIIA
jgi:hypothetical protein